MDRISKSLLEEFTKDAELGKLPEDQRFEHFATYLAITRHHAEAFSTTDLVIGSGGDTGIDAIGILVNGTLVFDPDEIRDLAETNGYIDASFVFVQAERSSNFDTAKIGQFGFGVTDFFADSPKLQRNEQVIECAATMTSIYALSSKFKRAKPTCKLYYVTTGKWVGDKNLEARRAAVVEDLTKLNLFSEVEFIPVDADGVERMYRQAKNAISREFSFARRAVVPEMPGVKEAHVGLVQAKEFVSLLDDGSGNILKSIFYDNVRDWQDYNPVNQEIRETLESNVERARFVLMNNGVTVIAKVVRPTADRFYIEDFQIVNGCQTSHVLFEQRALLDDSVFVPLRLIATTDEDVVADIVKATNRQTEVKQEQLMALSDFQKKLEAFFKSSEPPRRLYYERRSRQYSAVAGVEKTRIVTPTNVIRAYVSMFLGEPHRTTRDFSRLLARVGNDLFGEQHRLEPYYTAASAWYRLEYLFRADSISRTLKPARYQLLMAARILANPSDPPKANSNDVAKYAEGIATKIWDPDHVEKLFADAAKIVNKVAKKITDDDAVRTEAFTDSVRAAAEKQVQEG